MRLQISKEHIADITSGAAIPIVLGFLFACGTFGAHEGEIPFGQPSFYMYFLLFALLFLASFHVVFRFLAKQDDEALNIAEESTRRRSSKFAWVRFEYGESWKASFLDCVRIMACWLPYLLLLYPGVMYWDTGDQVAQFFGIPAFGQPSGMIWDHHPFLDTYLYGAFIWIGHVLTGNYAFGVFLHALAQYAVMGVIIARWLVYLKTRGLHARVIRVITCFLCFFPMFPIMFASMSKDVTYAIVFMAWMLMFARLVDSELNLLKSPKFLVGFVLLSLLSSMTKKLGMYIVVFCLVIVVFGKFKAMLKTISIAICAFLIAIVSVILPKCYYPVANIKTAGAQAAYAMPIEMLGRAAHAYPNDVSVSEKAGIEQFLLYSWDQISEQYNPYIADTVTAYNTQENASTLLLFKAWLKIGVRHPLTYVNAFFALESGWITFSSDVTSINTPNQHGRNYAVQMDPTLVTQTNPDTFGKLMPNQNEQNRQKVVGSILSMLKNTPILNVLMYVAVWTAVVPAFVMYYLWRRRKESAIYVGIMQQLPYLVSVALLFVYAVSLQIEGDRADPTRYMFHALLLAPFAMGLLLSGLRHKMTGGKPQSARE